VPSTAQFGSDARITLSSTPYGQDGLFANLYGQAESGELADAIAQHATTAEANPTITAEFLAAEEARDPESFKSEYMAMFVGGGAAFLDPDRIVEALTLEGEFPPPDNPVVARRYGFVAGLDPAFSSDPFGLAIVGRDPMEPGRLKLALAKAWKPSRRKPSSFEERREIEDSVLAEVAATCKHYHVRQVVTDQYAAPAIVDALRRKGLNVKTVPMTAASKTAAFLELRARLNARVLDLYEHPDLLAELRRLRTRYAAGSAAVVNPRVGGSHGDLAQALALAIHALQGGAPLASGAVRAGGEGDHLVRAFGGGHRESGQLTRGSDGSPGLAYDQAI
jgi:hypothetical protein